MQESENNGSSHSRPADPGGPYDFDEVLQAELREILPEPAASADARATIQTIDAGPPDLAALCLSGGGIRSATFALGVLQGLARFGLLGQFHYLSTVSGGGYIGSWLSAWRTIETDERIFAALNSSQQTGAEPPQIRGLRADSNYITPTLGLLSADTWTLVAVYIRNLILNWLLFAPFFMGCLLFPHWCFTTLGWAHGQPGFDSRLWIKAGGVLLTASLAFAICGRFRMRDEWLTQSRFLRLVLVSIVLSAMCFTFAAIIAHEVFWTVLDGALYGFLIYFAAWLLGRLGARRWDLRVLFLDLLCWVGAGAVVGAIIAYCMQLITTHPEAARASVVLGLSGVVLAYLAGDILYVGACSFSQRGEMDREWLARASGWLSAVAVTWAAVSSVALYAPGLLRSASLAVAGIGGLSGMMTLLLGSSGLTAATKAAEAVKHVSLARLASLAAVIFAFVLAALLALLGQQIVAAVEFDATPHPLRCELLVMVGLIACALVISLFVNVNRFSMHALYRNRLVRAFLGSARSPLRRPDPFTGFDPGDNPRMADVRPRQPLSPLFHVINAALNVVSSRNPAWQERKAESFVITRLHCGNPFVRYRATAAYGEGEGAITLGTAMAISGAAVSPNQGYNSSPLVGFLLMLFNVRLGWWLGNPKRRVSLRGGPRLSIAPALRELAGATTDEGPWVYLSDGGHFENLGLYEMVRRRCRFIVVSDAGCDPQCSFEDLGNAVRKIYIDFGVSINFRKLDIRARQNPPAAAGAAGVRFAIGNIFYPGSERPGWLLYIKPTYHGTTEGVDVRSYAADHPAFPHESTTDQWFSESQHEAYRALGAHIIESVCNRGVALAPGETPDPLTIHELQKSAEEYLWGTR
ncbi:MAG: patatin-like phospholipase family protein [Steroidobacteraceae bacterium]